MSAASSDPNHKYSKGEYKPAWILPARHIDLSRWTGDSFENGTDDSIDPPNKNEPREQKEKEVEQNAEEKGKTEKKSAESEPSPPSNPFSATPTRPLPQQRESTEAKSDGDGVREEAGTKTDTWREVVRSLGLH
ncbi:hypothetical protein MMC34_003305 [Xylographa carneopallida]|nr:hypothetical protein [Xylographa carneopallida]